MKAAMLQSPGVIEVVDYPEPTAGEGKVLVRVAAASICGSDIGAYRGYNARFAFPTILGHEIAGTIVEVGPGVDRGRIGSRVIVEPNVCCGTCPRCKAGLPNICPDYKVLGQNLQVQGGLAELVAVNANQVFDLPEHVSFAEGALVQPMGIAYHGVDQANVQAGEIALVLGAGPIGLGFQMIAQARGARTIVADVVDDRLAVAARLGAEVTVRADSPDFVDCVLAATDGRGADVVAEAVGGSQELTLLHAVRLAATRGRICLLGMFANKPIPFPAYDFKNREISLVGSHGHPRTVKLSLDLVAAGKLPVKELITHRMPLSEVARAFELLDARRDGIIKAVLEP